MIAFSRAHKVIAGAALIVAANAAVLGEAAYNRSGEPESTLALTQRELAPPYSYRPFAQENSGLSLRFQWRVLGDAAGGGPAPATGYPGIGSSPSWLDQAKLATLGFDVTRPIDTPEGRRQYDRMLPKGVFLVLEMDGPTYQAILKRARTHLEAERTLLAANVGTGNLAQRVKIAEQQVSWEERRSSRLFVVDAGLAPAALRARYPDRARYAIVRGQIQPLILRQEGRDQLSGFITGLRINEITVPHRYRAMLAGARTTTISSPVPPLPRNAPATASGNPPRYEISVSFGRRLEPWITRVATPSGE